ncbi:MAG: hypothetical protein WC284_10400 [Candidimonas sp.]
MRFFHLIAAGGLVLLGGCATNSVSPSLSGMDNVEIGPGPYGYQYVSKVSYRFDGVAVKGEALPMCVVQNVQNKSVTLQDSSSRQFMPYVGYVSKESAREVGGGQVITYLSDDKRLVMADGVTSYQTGSLVPINQSVRFSVALKASDNTLSAVFTNIDQAQMNTGAISNDGYSKLGAWSGMNPELAIGELKMIASNIADCVGTQQ